MSENNWKIIGHAWALKSLQQHAAEGTQKQAYLFTGPEAVGRRTLALRFAQALNCQQQKSAGIPCLECLTCGQIERMIHPDMSIVEPEFPGGSLKVEFVRDLQYGLHLAPTSANFRTALLLDFEAATDGASNALLKTLEEPPEKVVMLITAESAEQLLATIVSRCEVIRLGPVPRDILNAGIQSHWLVPPGEAELLTSLSGGRPGYCFDLHQKPDLMSQRKEWISDLTRLLSSRRVERFKYADQLRKKRSLIQPVLNTWLGLWRDVLLVSRNSSSPVTNTDYRDLIERMARGIDKDKVFQIVLGLDQVFYHLDRNVIPRLALEDLMLTLPYFPNE